MKVRTVARWFDRLAAAGVAAVLALALVPSAGAQGNGTAAKFSSEVVDKIKRAGADDLVPVIIQTHDRPSDAHFTRLHGRGGYVKVRHAAIRGYSGRVPAGQLAALAEDPEIERVSYDSDVQAHLDVAARAVRAAQAYVSFPGVDGRGVGVAVIDTGVWMHDDVQKSSEASKIVRVEVVEGTNSVNDQYGHGTHVAGIVAGNGRLSSDPLSFRTFRGVAPGARIISIRALYADGSGFTSDIIAALDWAIANRAAYNIRVINLSLGHPVFESYWTDPLCRAVRAAHDAGIVVVVAAGNDGHRGSGFGTITSPANDPTAITVGAMDDWNTPDTSDDALAWYSSKGPSLVDFVVKPDLVAPGTWIVSLRASESYLDTQYHELALQVKDYKSVEDSGDGAYYTLSGTSMAAPMVAGAAALMLQKDPSLNPATVKARLMASAVKDQRLIFETGAGYLDVDAALRAEGYASDALSPTAVLGSDGYVYITSTSLIWGISGGLWDLGIIWGGSDLWSLSLIWGFEKGLLSDGLLSLSPEEFVAASGAVWKGGAKCTTGDDVDNSEVTADSIIWGGSGSWLLSSTSTIEILGAVWSGGGGGGCRKC
jgi:serine protease AprX